MVLTSVAVDVKLADAPQAFSLPEWSLLARQDPNGHIFASPEWNELWWESFGSGKRLAVLTFLDPDPVAIVPLMVDQTEQGNRIRFVGGDDLTDYLGPVMQSNDLATKVSDALISFLKEELTGWDYFDAKCLPVPFRFADALCDSADRLGLRFQVDQTELTAVLDLPETFDDYLTSLPQKKRHEIRRKVRRFNREEPGAQLRSPSGTVEEQVQEFIRMHRGSEGLKGKFMLPDRASFFEAAARRLSPMGWVAIDFLDVRGRAIAATFSFPYRNVFYLYNSAYDHDFKDVSPGLVLVTKLIERSIEQGCRRFDFLRGRERYKFDLGAEAVPLHSVLITR